MAEETNKGITPLKDYKEFVEKQPSGLGLAYELSPITGEAKSLADIPEYYEKTKEDLESGDYLDASGNAALYLLSALGAIPAVGLAPRALKSLAKNFSKKPIQGIGDSPLRLTDDRDVPLQLSDKTNEIKLIEDKKLREQEAITRQMKREQMLDQLDDKYGYVDPEDYITGGLHPYETLDGKRLEKYLEYLNSSIVPGSKKDLIDPKLEPFGKGGKESIVYESVPSKGKGSEYQRAERIIVRQYEGTSPKTGKPMYTQKTFIPNRTFVKDIASYFGYKKGGSIIASNPYGNYEPRGI